MKNLKKFVFSIIALFAFTISASAASGSITATSSTRTAVVGSTFTVSIRVNCSEALGAWQFGVNYDSAYLSLQSGDTNVADSSDGSIKSKTYTYKFKAIKSGNANIRISGPSIITWSENMFTPSVTNASVSIKTRQEIEANYSKDNTLKSLSVEGYELSPKFDKDTLEYKISVPDTIEEVKVSAKANDANAHVSGVGDVSISEGTNKIEVVVTAQNGSIKTYTIVIDVKDLNPIEVNIDGKTYTVVKKAELLNAPVGYDSTTIKIDDVEVPAFKNDLTELVIVGLKDEDGKISLYAYDDGKYTRYNELKGSITLNPLPIEELEGFTKGKVIINDVECESLVKENLTLIYGMNVETGEKGYYVYDKKTNNLISYDEELFASFGKTNKDFYLYLGALGTVTLILLIITILEATKNSKLKKYVLKLKTEPKAVTKETKKTKKEESAE